MKYEVGIFDGGSVCASQEGQYAPLTPLGGGAGPGAAAGGSGRNDRGGAASESAMMARNSA